MGGSGGFGGDGIRVIGDLTKDANPDFTATIFLAIEGCTISRIGGLGFRDHHPIGCPSVSIERSVFNMCGEGGALIRSAGFVIDRTAFAGCGWSGETTLVNAKGIGLQILTLGASADRVRAGVSYVMVSMVSSLIFLAGIAFAYAATGTLNMADMALRFDNIPPGTRTAIFAVLLVAFGIKAAVFPLSAWLPDSYPTAPAPITAVFAGLLTKVGVYAIIRAHSLLFPQGELDNVLMVCGLLTMVVFPLALAPLELQRRIVNYAVAHSAVELLLAYAAWDYDHLYEFIKNPGKYISGTKMTFVGLKKPEDRINVIAYLHAQGGTIPFPAPNPAAAAPAAPAEGAEAAPADAAAAPAAGAPAAAPAAAAPAAK